MNQKESEQKNITRTKTKTVPKKSINNISSINNINNQKNLATPISKDNRQFNVQLTILDSQKKLKINLEISEGYKSKRIYITTLSLEELISLNDFFSQFKDYSEAFDFLLKNFTKIDRDKITYKNNNNDITIILLFSINENDEENNNDIIEEGIKITLHKYNNNKSLTNINNVINNLKLSLEKFNLSIKELKNNVSKDKIEYIKRINELDLNYNEIKKIMEENNIKQKNEINKNNKIFLEKENELSKLITEKFEDFINRINSYDEKNVDLENNFNEKLQNLDNKTNIFFNELIKKINSKNNYINNNNTNYNEDKLNGIINNILEENENLEKRLEEKVIEKIEAFSSKFNDKIKLLEEKIDFLDKNEKKITNEYDIMTKMEETEERIKILEKNFALNKNDDKDKNEYMNNVNSLIKKKLNELENYKANILNNFEKNESSINENKMKINDIDNQIIKIYEEINKNKNGQKEEKINELEKLSNDLNKKTNELSDKLELYNKNNINYLVDKNINELKAKINKIIEENESNKQEINNKLKTNIEDINTKIKTLRTDLFKSLDIKNGLIDNKFNYFEGKISFIESELNKSQEKIYDNNKIFFVNKKEDNNLNNLNLYDEKIYSSKTLDNNNIFSKKNKNKSSKKNILSKTVAENNLENIEKDSDNSDKKVNIRNTFYVSSSNLLLNHMKERNNVFDLYINSNILKNEEITENFFIFKKLKEIYAYNRYIKLNLIYRASRDGDMARDFHFKCDFIGPNITFIKTKKEYVFGAFTIKTWKHLFKDIKKEEPECGTELKDEQAFGFSLNKSKIYENGKKDENIIYCNSNFGPCFKNFFFKIYDKCFENGGICGKIKESNFIGIEKEFEYNGGEEEFDVEEIEVFQLGFR